MILQNKFELSILLLLCSFFTFAQEGDVAAETNIADSLHEVYTQTLNRKLYLLENRLLQVVGSQEVVLDSLSGRAAALEEEVNELRGNINALDVQLEETVQQSILNNQMIFSEKEQFRRILVIAGPTLLGLILISTVLFFVLVMRQGTQTQRKIMALRKYTHSEVEETRSELLKNFKKRIRKLRDRIGKEYKKKPQAKNRTKAKKRRK
jgi:hypothetical protein